MSTVLVIDGMVLAYRQFHAVGHLANSKKEPTGLRFGFLRAAMSYQKKFKASEVTIVWDMPGPILKAQHTPEYKLNRESTPERERMFDQLPQLRDTLAKTRWNQVFRPGYEADDLIAAVVKNGVKNGKQVVIITTDTDLYQLLEPGVVLWTGKAEDGITDRNDVKKAWAIWPEQMPVLRAVMGDVSDNLKPLGNKVVIATIQQHLETHPEVKSVGQLPFSFGQSNEMVFRPEELDWWKQLEDREKLMRPLFPEDDILGGKFGAGDREALLKEFQEMESKSLSERIYEMV